MTHVSDFKHLVPHICGSNCSVELLTQQSKPFHAYKEAKVLRPHTHCTDYNALQHPHIKRLKKRDLHCDAILCKCDARSPVKVTVSSDMVKETERRVKLWDNCASCIINMDGTLTLLVRLICVSIPLAAVQTSPGFTVH